MCPAISGMLENLAGEFLHDSTQSESPSLSLELAADVTSLSGLEVGFGVVAGPSVGFSWFELFLLVPMATDVALLGAAASVIAWATREAPTPVGGAVLPAPSVGTGGENSGSSG